MSARSPSERQRLRRQRKRDGVRRVLVDVSPVVVSALEADGWLGQVEADDRTRLGDTVSDVLECWAEGRLCSRRLRDRGPAPAPVNSTLLLALSRR